MEIEQQEEGRDVRASQCGVLSNASFLHPAALQTGTKSRDRISDDIGKESRTSYGRSIDPLATSS
jgi:hypothetical protein